jgi:hypothetical protein
MMANTLTAQVDEARSSDPPTPGARPPGASAASSVRRFFGVVADTDSYRNIGYLLLGLPFGVVWVTALVTGASIGVSMLVVALAGIPMLVGMWYAARAFANVERGLANSLLHQRLGYAPIASPHRGNLWARLRAMSREADRWREVGYLWLRFPAGVATFTAAVATLSAALWVVWAPFHVRIVSNHPFGRWSGSSDLEDLSSSMWSWLLVPLGLMLLVLAFHVLNAIAAACGRWTSSALAVSAASEVSA